MNYTLTFESVQAAVRALTGGEAVCVGAPDDLAAEWDLEEATKWPEDYSIRSALDFLMEWLIVNSTAEQRQEFRG